MVGLDGWFGWLVFLVGLVWLAWFGWFGLVGWFDGIVSLLLAGKMLHKNDNSHELAMTPL